LHFKIVHIEGLLYQKRTIRFAESTLVRITSPCRKSHASVFSEFSW